MQSLLWLGAPCLFTSNFGVAAINAVNSGSESWTGIGVVAGFGAVVLIVQSPHGRNGEAGLSQISIFCEELWLTI